MIASFLAAREMGRPDLMLSADMNDSVPRFVRPPEQDCAANALDLVYQAAKVFSSMEDHAREVEARAESICRSAAEKLRHAERRIEAAEDRVTAMEFRVQVAEAEARKAKQALALVEEAIRRRLLCAHPKVERSLGEVT